MTFQTQETSKWIHALPVSKVLRVLDWLPMPKGILRNGASVAAIWKIANRSPAPFPWIRPERESILFFEQGKPS